MAGNSVRFTASIDDKVSAKLGIIGKKFDNTFGKGSSASLFGNVGAKAVAKGFSLLDDAISGTIGFIDDAVQAAIEDQASNARMLQSLKNNIPGWDGNTDAIQKYIDKQTDRGFADDDTRDSIGQLIGVTHDLNKAMELNALAEDLARAKGIPLSEATDIVTKAFLGNSKALKPLGIDIAKGADAAAILDAVQKNVKGSADNWNDTMAGKLNKSQLAFNEAVEKIGYTLLPVLATAMQDFTNWLNSDGLKILGDVGDAMRGIGDMAEFATGKVRGLFGWTQKFNRIDNVLDKIRALDKLHGGGGGQPPKAFASGGWVGLNGPELAIVGEKGPEYITPNNKLGGGGGGGFTIQGVTQDQITDMVERKMYFRLQRAAPTQQRS